MMNEDASMVKDFADDVDTLLVFVSILESFEFALAHTTVEGWSILSGAHRFRH